MAEINNVIAEASQDLQTIEDFVNLPAGSEVRPRLLPSVNVGTLAGTRQAIFEAGGLPATPFATKALMTASALVDGDYAMVTDDTTNNGLYVKTAGAWVKSSYDPLVQANAYADDNKLDLQDITYGYEGGNLVGTNSKRVDGYYINEVGNYTLKSDTASVIIPVTEGDLLFLHNVASQGIALIRRSFGFYDKDPSNEGGAEKVAHTSVSGRASGINYFEVTVPSGAKFLTLTSKYVSPIDWSVHRGAFSDSFTEGAEVVLGLKGKRLSDQTPSIINSMDVVSETAIDLATPENILNKYLNTQEIVLSGVAKGWSLLRFYVEPSATYYIKVVGSQAFPFSMIYTGDFNGAELVEAYGSRGVVELSITDQEDVFSFTVPAELGITCVFMNIKTLEMDLTDTVSVQKGMFRAEDIGKTSLEVSGILGKSLSDDYARDIAVTALSKNSKTRFTGTKIFTFGDSITQGTEGGYVKYIEQGTQAKVENYAMNGSKEDRMFDKIMSGLGTVKRDSATSDSVWPVIDFLEAKAVTIMIGTNVSEHLTSGSRWGSMDTLPTGNIYESEDVLAYIESFPNNFTGNIAACIEYIKYKNPAIEIHIITPPYRYSAQAVTTHENYRGGEILKITPYLRDLCTEYACHFIPAYESGISYKGMDKTNGTYTYDGTHFNELGNKVFGKYIAQKVLNYS